MVRAYWRRRNPMMTYEEFDAKRDAALETAAIEAKEDARSRCTVPPWAFDKCAELQEWAIDNMRDLILNDQNLYEQGPYHYTYWPTVHDNIDWMKAKVEDAFKPYAEEELRKMYRVDPERPLAHEIGDRLMAPFVEQFTEIPREQRLAAVKHTNEAIRHAMSDYSTSLRANWPRGRP